MSLGSPKYGAGSPRVETQTPTPSETPRRGEQTRLPWKNAVSVGTHRGHLPTASQRSPTHGLRAAARVRRSRSPRPAAPGSKTVAAVRARVSAIDAQTPTAVEACGVQGLALLPTRPARLSLGKPWLPHPSPRRPSSAGFLGKRGKYFTQSSLTGVTQTHVHPKPQNEILLGNGVLEG